MNYTRTSDYSSYTPFNPSSSYSYQSREHLIKDKKQFELNKYKEELRTKYSQEKKPLYQPNRYSETSTAISRQPKTIKIDLMQTAPANFAPNEVYTFGSNTKTSTLTERKRLPGTNMDNHSSHLNRNLSEKKYLSIKDLNFVHSKPYPQDKNSPVNVGQTKFNRFHSDNKSPNRYSSIEKDSVNASVAKLSEYESSNKSGIYSSAAGVDLKKSAFIEETNKFIEDRLNKDRLHHEEIENFFNHQDKPMKSSFHLKNSDASYNSFDYGSSFKNEYKEATPLRIKDINSSNDKKSSPDKICLYDSPVEISVSKFSDYQIQSCPYKTKTVIKKKIALKCENGEYDGFVVDGKVKDGQGKMKYSDGSVYEGNWVNNKREGSGTLYYDNGSVAYEGEWENDQFHGQGKQYNKSVPKVNNVNFDIRDFNTIGNCWIHYIGKFKKNLRSGVGELLFAEDLKYYGKFKKNLPNGNGSILKNNKKLLCGSWRHGKIDSTYFYQN